MLNPNLRLAGEGPRQGAERHRQRLRTAKEADCHLREANQRKLTGSLATRGPELEIGLADRPYKRHEPRQYHPRHCSSER